MAMGFDLYSPWVDWLHYDLNAAIGKQFCRLFIF